MNENALNHYLVMLNNHYKNGTNNHEEHNSNPRYWDILLGEIKRNPNFYSGKKALDFGCGKGRNVTNMLSLANFESVNGIDVSEDNIVFCNNSYDKTRSSFFKNSGKDLSALKNEDYDFVMSTIVLQHICVHELRFNLFKEIHRVMKTGGIFSFQMGYGPEIVTPHISKYFDNNYSAAGSNGANDVRISDPNTLVADLKEVGFNNISYEIHESHEDPNHPQWIYVKCQK